MDKQFLMQLKETLVNLDSRLQKMEHIVNEVLIDGMKEAADTVAENEKYSAFVDSFGPTIEPFKDKVVVLYGDELEPNNVLYEAMKKIDGYGSEGFDEANAVNEMLNAIDEEFTKRKDSYNSIGNDVGAADDDLAKSFIEAYRA